MLINPAFKISLRLYCGDEIAMGPGKADLLDAIKLNGSISAAGRTLGMSYRRAWLLVDALNRCWMEPLVVTARGVAHGGGARLTDFGETHRNFDITGAAPGTVVPSFALTGVPTHKAFVYANWKPV